MKTWILSIAIGIIGLIATAQETYTLTVEVSNVTNDKGQLVVGLYNSEEGFLEDTFMGQFTKISNGKSIVTFNNVPKGTYAVSLFHDENSNRKLDSNFMGIPKEDYAASNNAKGFMGPPKWKDAKFDLHQDLSIEIEL